MILKFTIAGIAVTGATAVALALTPPMDDPSVDPLAGAAKAPLQSTAPTVAGERYAQRHSPKCQTPGGLCYVPAAPVGSPCQCGRQSGRIIP